MKSLPAVFVVDDEEPIRRAFEILLRRQSIAVRTFASAEAFLELYSVDWAGCLFADVRMPNMSGSELYEELRRRNTSLSIILMTGHGSTDSLRDLLGSETIVLEKPLSAEELQEIVRFQWSRFFDGDDPRRFDSGNS